MLEYLCQGIPRISHIEIPTTPFDIVYIARKLSHYHHNHYRVSLQRIVPQQSLKIVPCFYYTTLDYIVQKISAVKFVKKTKLDYKKQCEYLSEIDTNYQEYSSISRMCISKFRDNKCKMLNRNGLGRAIRGVLAQAKNEGRLICGLLPAISYLEKAADDTLMCLLPETRPGDSASHLQTVLLQAFCYENYIPVIKVDSSEKLAELCGLSGSVKSENVECPCVLITRDLTIPWDTNLDPPLTNGEQTLADFYECTLEEYPTPVVQLPR